MMSCAFRRASATPPVRRVSVSSSMTWRTVAIAPTSGATRGSFTEPILSISILQCFDQGIDFAPHHLRKFMHREPDAMIGHAVLRKVVSADFSRTIACTNLRFSHPRALSFLFRDRRIEQTGAQNFHCLELVLQL